MEILAFEFGFNDLPQRHDLRVARVVVQLRDAFAVDADIGDLFALGQSLQGSASSTRRHAYQLAGLRSRDPRNLAAKGAIQSLA